MAARRPAQMPFDRALHAREQAVARPMGHHVAILGWPAMQARRLEVIAHQSPPRTSSRPSCQIPNAGVLSRVLVDELPQRSTRCPLLSGLPTRSLLLRMSQTSQELMSVLPLRPLPGEHALCRRSSQLDRHLLDPRPAHLDGTCLALQPTRGHPASGHSSLALGLNLRMLDFR